MDFIESYKDMFGVRKFTSNTKLKPGSVVQFTYDGEQKYAVVLNPNWQGRMHALSLKSLSASTLQNLLNEIVYETDPDALYAKYKSSTYTENRPYRTYTITKIKSLREIYLKPIE